MSETQTVFCESCGLVRLAPVVKQSKLTLMGMQKTQVTPCPFCTFTQDTMRNMEALAAEVRRLSDPVAVEAVAEAEKMLSEGEN